MATYSSGSLIEAQHYNTFVWGSTDGDPDYNGNSGNNLYNLWGTGYGNKGLGQTMDLVTAKFDIDPNTSGTQSTGELYAVTSTVDQVKAVQWTGLVAAINRLRYHQTAANLAINGVSVGSTVEVIASINSTLSSSRTAMGTGRLAGVDAGALPSLGWVFNSTASTQTTTFTRTATFQTGNAARYFFNGGGILRVRVTATTSGSERSVAMVDTINGMGTCDFKYDTNSGFSGTQDGTQPGAGKGYWDMGTSYLRIGRHVLGTGVYSDDFIECYAKVAGTTESDGDVGNQVSFQIKLSSGFGATGTATGPGGAPTWLTDSMNIAVNFQIDIYEPSTLVLIDSWGTVSVS